MILILGLAIGNLHTIFKYLNQLMGVAKKENEEKITIELDSILKEVKEIYGVLGFFKQDPEIFLKQTRDKYLRKMGISSENIEEEISKRIVAKKNKNFEVADKIRNDLKNEGIILNDSKDGTSWDLEELY